MSAPVKERSRAGAGGTAVLDAPARPTRTTIPAQRGRPSSDATGRAYARRDERLRRLGGHPAARPAGAGRTQFVLLVMVLLAAGLVATLWLSTAAAADSYQLQNARAAAQKLTEQSEQLHREVAEMESAPALAQRATELGMGPVTDAARLVVARDGTVTVVGTPKAVAAPAAAAPAAASPPAAVTTADGQAAAGDAAAPAAGAAAAGPTGAGPTGAAPAAAGRTTAGPTAAPAATGQAGAAPATAGARTAGTGAAAGGAGPAAGGTRTAGTGATTGPATGAAAPARSGGQPAGTH